MSLAEAIQVLTISGIGEISSGDDLSAIIVEALGQSTIVDGDIFVIAQKIVSKAEGRCKRLSQVAPGEEAHELAKRTEKDPGLVQLVLDETETVVKSWPGTIVSRDSRGLVMANAGIDRSNCEDGSVILLPIDPDQSARRIRGALEAHFSARLGVIIADSFGRPWRRGVVGTAIGASGVEVLSDCRGSHDRNGRSLETTDVAAGDALAASAVLAMGEAAQSTPVAVIRGWDGLQEGQVARDLQRPLAEDRFA